MSSKNKSNSPLKSCFSSNLLKQVGCSKRIKICEESYFFWLKQGCDPASHLHFVTQQLCVSWHRKAEKAMSSANSGFIFHMRHTLRDVKTSSLCYISFSISTISAEGSFASIPRKIKKRGQDRLQGIATWVCISLVSFFVALASLQLAILHP